MSDICRQLACSALVLIAVTSAAGQTPSKPNVIYILADDLGYGSVGFNNPSTPILTPNLDALAAGGMRMTFNYCPASVCAPTRASLMTGFHNGHTAIDRNGNIGTGFRAQDLTAAQVLKTAGYRTSTFGKWGFGSNDEDTSYTTPPSITNANSEPRNRGFDQFYGYMSHGGAHNYYSPYLWSGNTTSTVPVATGNTVATPTAAYTHDLIAQQSLNYITANAGAAEPFYMHVAYTIPHFDIDQIVDAPGGLGVYANDPNLTTAEKKVAAMITRMDSSIGDIVARLRDPDGNGNESDSILNNTLIVFSTDNGATQEDSTPWSALGMNAPLRGGKRDLFEGGVRSPTVAYWNGTIAPGSTSSLLSDTADFLPTVAELAGVRGPVGMDGVSFAATLTGQGIQRPRDYLYLEHNEGDGPDADTRDARWAVIRPYGGELMKLVAFSDGSMDLFNITTDIAEASPLNQALSTNAQIVADLQALAAAEGGGQPDSFAVDYKTWTGANGGVLGTAGNWGGSLPAAHWSAVLANTDAGASTVSASGSVSVLGLEVVGPSASRGQTLRVLSGVTVTGRNEVRISEHGRIMLDRGTLQSNRWTDVLRQGTLAGHGDVIGAVYNAGVVAPGRPADLPPVGGGGSVNTGVVDAINFNFAGVANNQPLTATSTLNPNLALVAGLTLGSGTAFATGGGVVDEFNYSGHTTTNALSAAITAADYITYTVQPTSGIEMLVDDISFTIRRNGTNAAKSYAIMTSQAGFVDGSQLGTLVTTGSADVASYDFTATYTGGQWTNDALEVRLYGYDSGQTSGNTHLTAASLDASFRSVPGSVVGPTGRLSIFGDYTQMAGADLLIDIAGRNGGGDSPQYDSVAVAGVAGLAGNFTVTLLDGFAPVAGDSFDILVAQDINGVGNSLSGMTFSLPDLTGNAAWGEPEIVALTGGGEALRLTVVPEPGGLAGVAFAALACLRRRRRGATSAR